MGRDWHRADIQDERFGRLRAMYILDRRIGGHAVWRCECDCGGHTETTAHNLISGNTLSCGCEQIRRTLAYSGFGGQIVRHDAAALEAARKAAGVTLQKIADEAKVSIARIARIMSGKCKSVPMNHLAKICKVIGVDHKTVVVAILGRKSSRSE